MPDARLRGGGKIQGVQATPAPPPQEGLDESLFGSLVAMASLNEEDKNLPEPLQRVRDHFVQAARQTAKMPGGTKTLEADEFRHVEGAKASTQDLGAFTTFIGSTAHEVASLKNALEAAWKGHTIYGVDREPLTFGDIARESGIDMVNNIRGIAQALVGNNGPAIAQGLSALPVENQ